MHPRRLLTNPASEQQARILPLSLSINLYKRSASAYFVVAVRIIDNLAGDTRIRLLHFLPYIYPADPHSSSILFSTLHSPFNSSSRSISILLILNPQSSCPFNISALQISNLGLTIPLFLPEHFASYHGIYKQSANLAPFFLLMAATMCLLVAEPLLSPPLV